MSGKGQIFGGRTRPREAFTGFRNGVLGLLVAFGLANCAPVPQSSAPVTSPTPEAQTAAPSAASLELASYYSAAQARLLTQGLLRTDGGTSDAAFSAADLAANFERIALYDEYTVRGGRFVQRQTPSRLRRWSVPVTVRPIFGASTPAAEQTRDTRILTNYVARLGRVTGHPMRVTESGTANYHVLFLSLDEQRAAAPLLHQLVPGLDTATLASITQMERFTYCSVYAFSDRTNPNTYVAAIAVIRTEHPYLLRQSCIHEEVAQGLGLANDSPEARPSIFNDDEEFAFLTAHDEHLLNMLYDPRLRPGMTPDQARPLVTQLAIERLGGNS